jgi:hypothetical protein
VARYDLHLTADEFYDLTPRQFDALLRRHQRKEEHDEFMFAQLTSWVANTGFKSASKVTQPKDFMPSQWAKTLSRPTPSKPKRMTRKRRFAIADGIRSMFPPTPKR